MSSIMPIMLEILALECVICSMAPVASRITSPPSSAVCDMAPRLDRGFLGALGILRHGRGQLFHGRRGFLDGRSLLGGALGQVIGARQDLAGRILEAARGSLELGDDLGELVGHGVGIGLERVEGAGIVTFDAVRQIGIGQRGQHGAGFAETPVDGFDQIVDASGQGVELGIGELGGDALGEIAGDSGIHHFAEGTLQFLHHFGTFDTVTFETRGFFLGHLAHLDSVLAEDLDGPGHAADLVAAILSRHLNVVVALDHGVHGRGHLEGIGREISPEMKTADSAPTMREITEITAVTSVVLVMSLVDF